MKFSLRQMRGLAIVAAGGQVKRISDELFWVKSQSTDAFYIVMRRVEKWGCNCLDFEATGKPCKHVYATFYALDLPNILSANSSVFGGSDTSTIVATAKR